MNIEYPCNCSARSMCRGTVIVPSVVLALLIVSIPLARAQQVQVLDGAGLGAYGGQLIPRSSAVQVLSQPQVFSAEEPQGVLVANPYAALLAAASQARAEQAAQQSYQAQDQPSSDPRSFAEAQAAGLLGGLQPSDYDQADKIPGPRIQVVQQERPAMAVRMIAQPQVRVLEPDQISSDLAAQDSLQAQDAPTPESVLAEEAASAQLAATFLKGISNITSTLAQRYSDTAAVKANETATAANAAGQSQAGQAIKDAPDGAEVERKAIGQVLQPSNILQTAGSESSAGDQQPSLTVVKVQQSASEPGIRHVEVLTLQKTAAKTAKLAALAKRPEDARLEAAAAPAGALQAVVAPVQAPAAQPSEEPSFVKVFQQRKVEKSFQRSAEEALRRIAAAPASDVEVIAAPDAAPGDGVFTAPAEPDAVRADLQKKKRSHAPAPAPAAGDLTAIQANRKIGGDSLGAQVGVAAPAEPRVANVHRVELEVVQQNLAAATHPAVIWQSHLLDITPAQWPSYKSSYITGIAQGANVAESQVSIVGVTSATTVTVNTQITYPNDDTAAAKELAGALTDAQGSPIYVPNFGQVQVSGVTQLDAPAVPQFASSSQVSWTGTSAAALGPASPSVYAPPLQASATSQQSIAALSQQPPAAGDATAIPQVKRQDKVYNNNGLPLWAAIGIPVGVIVVVALLLVAAKHQRARTERLTKSLLAESAANKALTARRGESDESET